MTPNRQRDPEELEKLQGRAMLATIVFFVVVGTGIGAFYEAGAIGAVIGGATGIAFGFWLVPRLLDEWVD